MSKYWYGYCPHGVKSRYKLLVFNHQKQNSKNVEPTLNNDIDIDFRRVKPNRNVDNTQRKYMKLSKKELVQRLILAEQYIAENNSKWVANYFEMFK